MAFILLTNLVIFAQRAYYFRNFPMLNGLNPNFFYIISRGTARTILFNTFLVLVLVLRYTITFLRKIGMANYLPLDYNIYFHKVVGTIICFQGFVHGLMHLLNFKINIQPNPVKFIYMSWGYWIELNSYPLHLYKLPKGCYLTSIDEEESVLCEPESFQMPDSIANNGISRNISLCQYCETGESYTYYDWIFTRSPGMFGGINGAGGIACITGVVLMAILFIMFLLSLPVIRKSGYFQLFYLSHMLYFVYFFVLILHAPSVWKWFLVPAIMWLLEIIYRSLTSLLGHGRTYISSGVVLPSKVVCLVIRRPVKFCFNAGDMVYVKIPKISKTEWHPFTISSAPEVDHELTLHIRAVGGWTNSLYNYFVEEYRRNQAFSVESRNVFPRKTQFERSMKRSLLKHKVVEYDVYEDDIRTRRIEMRNDPLQIYIDGPFGCPSSNVYRAEHAVLIGTGIGVTPFASILQSIMYRYWDLKKCCPNCNYKWAYSLGKSMFNLKKVDFIWINRDIKSFEWFVDL